MSDAIQFATPSPSTTPSTKKGQLRLWPALVIVALLWMAMKLPAFIVPEEVILQFMFQMWAPMIAGLLMLLWWLFASRLTWGDKGFGIAALFLSAVAAMSLYHPSINPSGNPMFVLLFVLPIVATVWAGWLLLTPFLRWPDRRAGLALAFLCTFGYFALLRFEGTTGSFEASLPFRWVPTAEELALADMAKGSLRGQAET